MTGDDDSGRLHNPLDVFRAVERVEQLTGCLEDTDEEAELRRLVAVLEEWLAANPYRE
ncbi:hypothetical protein [Bosea sp. 2RAB26]|uniref:hypothetical protein n=1 Tax=Bosea sp. 2RAB26 TaxID=3237476 RepID=UPI003F93E161